MFEVVSYTIYIFVNLSTRGLNQANYSFECVYIQKHLETRMGRNTKHWQKLSMSEGRICDIALGCSLREAYFPLLNSAELHRTNNEFLSLSLPRCLLLLVFQREGELIIMVDNIFLLHPCVHDKQDKNIFRTSIFHIVSPQRGLRYEFLIVMLRTAVVHIISIQRRYFSWILNLSIFLIVAGFLLVSTSLHSQSHFQCSSGISARECYPQSHLIVINCDWIEIHG